MIGTRLGQLQDLWVRVRDSFLLVPTVMVLLAVMLAVGMVYLDEVLRRHGVSMVWVTTLSSDGARAILSTLAGSMATIVGIVFSIVPVAMQLAASQFGPHAMRGFLSDRGSQIALGTFSGLFAYALVVMVTGRSGQNGFVPYAATYMGVLLGIAAIGELIYYINHITRSMRGESVIGALARDLRLAIDTVFPDELGHSEELRREEVALAPDCLGGSGRPVLADRPGYVRRVDEHGLMKLASQKDLLIRLDVRPGDFVIPGVAVMTAGPGERACDAVLNRLRDVVVIGDRRTPEQDVRYALQQLMEVAVRSLSPGIYAPYVAIPAIDHIGAGLALLAERRLPALERVDGNGRLRVVVSRGLTLAGLTRDVLLPIAHVSADQADVLARLVQVAIMVKLRARHEEDREALGRFAEELAEQAQSSLSTERERRIVKDAELLARSWTKGAERLAG